jgi:hypothetical protein
MTPRWMRSLRTSARGIDTSGRLPTTSAIDELVIRIRCNWKSTSAIQGILSSASEVDARLLVGGPARHAGPLRPAQSGPKCWRA